MSEDVRSVIRRLWSNRHVHYGDRLTLRSLIKHARIERDTQRREARGE